MPCMGPNKEHAYEVGERAFDDVIELLRDKYDVEVDDGALESVKKLQYLPNSHRAETLRAREVLRTAIKELVWCEHCMTW